MQTIAEVLKKIEDYCKSRSRSRNIREDGAERQA